MGRGPRQSSHGAEGGNDEDEETRPTHQDRRRGICDSLMRRQCHIALPLAFIAYVMIHYVLHSQNRICSERNHVPFSSWTHHVNTAVAACFMLSSVHYFSVGYCFLGSSQSPAKGGGESESTMDHPRSMYFAAATLSSISCVSVLLSIRDNYGPVCVDALGVETLRNQWPEWLVALPLLGYIAIAVEDKPKLTNQDVVILTLMFLTIFFGFVMNLFPSPGYETVGFTFYALSSICMGSNVYMAVLSDKQLTQLISRQSGLKINEEWQAERLIRKSHLSWLLVGTLPTFAVLHLLKHFRVVDRDLLIVGNMIFGLLTKLIFTGILSYEALAVQMTLERRANESRRRFLRYVFHEVRVPLNTITMGLSVLENDYKDTFEPNSVPHEVLMMMTGAAGFMNDTLNDVLSMSKIEDGSMTLTMQPFKLESLVSGALVVINGQARSKGILLDVDYSAVRPKDYSLTLSGDRFRLEHVLVNFLSNAIKFSPEGSTVTVTVKAILVAGGEGARKKTAAAVDDEKCRRVGAKLTSEPIPAGKKEVVVSEEEDRGTDGGGDQGTVTFPSASPANTLPPTMLNQQQQERFVAVTLLVRDRGVGISPENQAKLFVPFSQIRSHELQQGRGTGLGLVLAKEIIELHGGRVILESEEGKGSTFGFSVKLSVIDQTDEADSTSETAVEVLKKIVLESAQRSRANSDDGVSGGSGLFPLFFLNDEQRRKSRSRATTPASSSGTVTPSSAILSADDRDIDYISSVQRFGGSSGSLGTDVVTHLPDGMKRILRPSSSSVSLTSLAVVTEESSSMKRNTSSKRAAGTESPGGSWELSIAALNGHDHFSESQHEGNAVGSSMDGGASSFSPCSQQERQQQQEGSSTTPIKKGVSLVLTKKYLLVDDTLSNCKMLRMLLARHKIDCELAFNGQEAVDAVRDRGDTFDVIFMDHTMPIKSGLEATPEIRALGFDGLIIGLTGNALDDDVDRFLQAGADSVFAKPFTDTKLSMILALIEKYGTRSNPGIRQALLHVMGRAQT